MSETFAPPKPQPRGAEFDIYHGADINDLGEIIGALKEDETVLDRPEELTGKTALTIACADGNFLAAQYLLEECGADPWITDKHVRTPLDYARSIGHDAIRAILLRKMFPDLDEPRSPEGVIPLFPNR